MVAILGYSRPQILTAVQQMYTAVADRPASPFHFPVGADASRRLGYAPERLATLPTEVSDAFAGVGCPFRAEAIRRGDRVLDIGSGAGGDALIARQLTGPQGHVIALDLTAAMTRRLQQAAERHAIDHLAVVQGSAEQLPLPDASIDSITSNGALNLVPDKRLAIAEMFRVLKPHGRVQLADVVIHRPVSVDCHEDPRLWVECVVGATVKEELLALFEEAGFEDVTIVGSHDYFALSPSAQTREIAAGFGAHSVEIGMRRGAHKPAWLQRWWRRLDPRRWLRLWYRRGLLGMLAWLLALLSCYGTLALVALLPLLGVHLTLDEGLWAGTIAALVLLTLAMVATGIRRHHTPWPALTAAGAALLVLYALFIDYDMALELSGFVLLAVAVGWDVLLRRRSEAELLGVEKKWRDRSRA
ncbi:methyltransferase domain-containing protein [Halomonas daqingensis]|uniref:Arsenite methyltransferase n=1 Tax=Billgrantia desiderata TaxID=52021 RepID=A0ABS9B219_9GAMM|nr:MerC family mercury resistance protein [Halomonas desiderata]MCE8041590.1 methyltransferase domain-containing protein [Halomonas desiderata]MCE8046165.1 methyltransferase domain-containing protein [Halomonas desiderata]